MRLTVLGGCGGVPEPGGACSGYLVEHEGFHLLIDPGHATYPRLIEHITADDVGGVLVSHEHPDHCLDVNPLLRARLLGDRRDEPLPLHALPGTLDAVLAVEPGGRLDRVTALRTFEAGETLDIGPFTVETMGLPHYVPNAGFRITAGGGSTLAYTGDTGPTEDILALARDADLFLCEATYLRAEEGVLHLDARGAADYATRAGARHLVLTHLLPGTSPSEVLDAAREAYAGRVDVARPGLVLEVGR